MSIKIQIGYPLYTNIKAKEKGYNKIVTILKQKKIMLSYKALER